MIHGNEQRLDLDAAFVSRLAGLARLSLTPEETERFAGELTRILAHVEQLAELDLDGVEPLGSAASGALRLRSDTPLPSLSPEVALAEAPSVADGGFVVPGFVDEG